MKLIFFNFVILCNHRNVRSFRIRFYAFNFICLFWFLGFRSGAVLSLLSSFCNHFPLHQLENKTDIICTVMLSARQLVSDEPCGHRARPPHIKTLRHSVVWQQVVFFVSFERTRFKHVCERTMFSHFCCGECTFHRNFHFVPPESVDYYHLQTMICAVPTQYRQVLIFSTSICYVKGIAQYTEMISFFNKFEHCLRIYKLAIMFSVCPVTLYIY